MKLNCSARAKFLVLLFLLLSLAKGFTQQVHSPIPFIVSGDVIKEGIDLYDNEKYKEAIEKYLSVSRNDSNYAWLLHELSISYIADKQYEKAIAAARSGLTLHSRYDINYYEDIGTAYDEAGKPDSSVMAYRLGMEKFPHYFKYWFETGVTYGRAKNDTAAVRCLEQSARMNPFHAGTHLQLGNIAARNNKTAAAMLSYQTFLLIENNTQRALNVLIALEALVKGESKVNPDSVMNISPAGDNFDELDQLIRSKAAINDKYKTKAKLPYTDLIKQVQVLLEKLNFNPDDKGFWNQYYASFYSELWKRGYFVPFIYDIFTCMNNDIVKKRIKGSQPDISKMIAWAGEYLGNYRAMKPEIINGKEKIVSHFYYDGGALNAYGEYDEKTKFKKGAWIFFHPGGYKKSEGTYNESGIAEGTWRFYYPDGGIKTIETYDSGGELNGLYESYYANGQIQNKGTYLKGNLEGRLETFSASGAPSGKMEYAAGARSGPALFFHDNGVKQSDYSFDNNKVSGKVLSFFSSGHPEYETTYTDDKTSGMYRSFNNYNGKLKSEGMLKDGAAEGEWKWYFDSGKINKTLSYKGGRENGYYKEYYETGQVESEGNYVNGNSEGVFKFYSEEGVLTGEVEYSRGKIKKYSYYDRGGKTVQKGEERNGTIMLTVTNADGAKIKEGTMKDGAEEGIWTYYHSNGQIQRVTSYEKGKKQGAEKTYYKNGILWEQTSYEDDQEDGYSITYYSNGNIWEEGWMKQGMKQGTWISYNPAGSMSARKYYADNEYSGYQEYYNMLGKKDYEDYYEQQVLSAFIQYDTTGEPYEKINLPRGTGHFESHHLNGKVSHTCDFRFGYKAGDDKYFFTGGKLSSISSRTNSELNGPYQSYYPNGNISKKGFYTNGHEDSTYSSYDENGKLKYTSTYVDGDEQGECTSFYPNGSKRFTGNYRNDKRDGYFTYYGEDGLPRMRLRYSDGKIKAYSYMNKESKWIEDVPVLNETGNIKAYYPNGNISCDFSLKSGYYEGPYRMYHSSGKIESDEVFSSHEKEGPAKYYFPNGQIQSEENYFYDRKNGTFRTYNEKGILLKEETFIMDEQHGHSRYYDPATGKLVKTVQYTFGQAYE